MRVLNPLDINIIINLLRKPDFLVVDHGWLTSGFSAELVAKL